MSQTMLETYAAPPPDYTRVGTVKILSRVLSLPTAQRVELIDLTSAVTAFAESAGIEEGHVHVSSLHTTAGVFINEWQQALLDDMKDAFSRLAPRDSYYRHNDPALSDCDRRNGDAHLRSLVVGQNVLIPLTRGGLALGRWQRVILAEFDGPNERRVFLQAFGV